MTENTSPNTPGSSGTPGAHESPGTPGSKALRSLGEGGTPGQRPSEASPPCEALAKQEAKQGTPDAPTTCPICKATVTQDIPTYPFCTTRCRTIDLGRWLGGDYKISRPIEQSDLEEE